MSLCSIVIPVRNHASVTRQCLNTLLAVPPRTVDAEIIVVDDGSVDETPRMLAGFGDRIRTLRHEESAGFATACNHGGILAGGEHLVFLNNDTIPQPGWLDALVGSARRHPRAGVVGAKLLFPNDTIQHAGVAFSGNGMPTHLYYRFPADHPAVNKARRFQAVTGACLLIRRDLFEALGGFDLAYFNVYEDIDLCLRAGERGYEVYYEPTSVVYHLQSVTRALPGRQLDPTLGGRHSLQTLATRWSRRVDRDEVRYYQDDGLLEIVPEVEYPRPLRLSPLVARLVENQPTAVDELLSERTKQVGDLLSQNIQLNIRLRELETRVMNRASGGGPLPPTWPALRASLPMLALRDAVAGLYLEGAGIEVGALHSPIRVTPPVSVRYVDRMSVADLRRQYPELSALPLVEPDILDNGEHLETMDDASQDFVIASHFLEHCQDPIGTVRSMLRVVKPHGILYLAVPDKRYTFDRNRPLTTLDHLVRDHTEGPAWSHRGHFEEWATLAEDVNINGRSAQELIDFDYSIHFHVWTQAEVLELFAAMKTRFEMPFDVELVMKNAIEVIVILRKHS